MKILHLLSSIRPESGGPVTAVKDLSDNFTLTGDEITICTSSVPKTNIFNKSVNIVYISQSYTSYRLSLSLLIWLYQNVRFYDVVIVNGIWQFQSLAIYLISHFYNVKYFIFPHGMLDPHLKELSFLKHFKKWIYWYCIESRVCKRAKNVIFTTQEEANLAKSGFFSDNIKYEIMKYGIKKPPQNQYYLRGMFFDKYSNLKGKTIILFMSRVHEKKGVNLLLDAFAQCCENNPTLHLLIAGPGSKKYLDLLSNHSKKLGISDHVTWLGMLSGQEKWSTYYAADVFCLPSHQENFGIVVAEALGCGIPVIISNRVNICGVVQISGAGFVNKNTSEGTLQSLQSWLELKESERNEMSKKAKSCFDENFDISYAAATLKNILTK